MLCLFNVKGRTLIEVFEIGALRIIFGPEREKVTGGWRKFIMRSFAVLYVITVIKSRRMRSTGHVARRGENRMHTKFCLGNLKEIYHLEDLGVDGSIILKGS
jgi:hypothetical protein